jgi:tetratricopeptide (TPR) repeat protein
MANFDRSRAGVRGAKSKVQVGQRHLLSSIFYLLSSLVCLPACAASPDSLYRQGASAYRAGEYAQATSAFREAVALQPASGTLQNLGNAEWQSGHTGAAILAWERALWLNPFNQPTRANLRFARKAAQLEVPELTWFEVVSTWLPMNWWAWLAGLCLWLAVGMGMLPGILRARKAAWHQALAAVGLAAFLLCVPAHLGIESRCRLGFVLAPDTPLRLTPTREAQYLTRLPSGEPARLEHARGRFLLIRTNRALGWIEKDQFGPICPLPNS